MESDEQKSPSQNVESGLPQHRPNDHAERNANAMIPREALERVLARAVQLQSVHPETPDAISESRMVEIAREVGIDAANLRQAIAEERARLPMSEDEQGFLLDAFGPGSTAVQRTVPGKPAEIIAKLEAWMPRMEMLEKRRRVGETLSWQPKRDTFGNMLRSIGMAGRQPDLIRTDQVAAVVMAIDDSRSVVRLQSDMYSARRTQRTVFVSLAIAFSAALIATAVPLLVLLPSTSLSVVGVSSIGAALAATGFAAWVGLRRSYRRLVDRAHLRLEQLLDELEAGGMQTTPGLLYQVRDALLGKPQ